MIDVLSDLFILRGVPGYIRSDNGPEFVAQAVQDWIAALGAKTAYIERGSTWENGYIESFNARLRDELLNGEIFYTLREAQIVADRSDTNRPHRRCSYRPSPRGRLRYVSLRKSRSVKNCSAASSGSSRRLLAARRWDARVAVKAVTAT